MIGSEAAPALDRRVPHRDLQEQTSRKKTPTAPRRPRLRDEVRRRELAGGEQAERHHRAGPAARRPGRRRGRDPAGRRDNDCAADIPSGAWIKARWRPARPSATIAPRGRRGGKGGGGRVSNVAAAIAMTKIPSGRLIRRWLATRRRRRDSRRAGGRSPPRRRRGSITPDRPRLVIGLKLDFITAARFLGGGALRRPRGAAVIVLEAGATARRSDARQGTGPSPQHEETARP